MPKFKIAVIVNSSQVFIIQADDPELAVEKISDAWDNSLISLDNPDSSEADFAFISPAGDDELAVL